MKVDVADAVWRKSSHSGPNGDCVEVAFLTGGQVAVRDTKDHGHGPVLAFAPGEWDTFVARVTSAVPGFGSHSSSS